MAQNPRPLIGSVDEFNPGKEEWVNYRKRIDIWFKVNKITDAEKANVFLAKVGPVAFEVLVNLTAPAEVDSKTYEELTALCEKHFRVIRTQEGERVTFRSCKQKPNQSITDYILELKKLSRYCGYPDLKDALKETFLAGLNNQFIKAKVMGDCAGKDFESCCDKALAVEKIYQETRVYLQHTKPETDVSVNHVNYKKCNRCNGNHSPQTCRFRFAKCNYCHKVGHISRVCWNMSSHQESQKSPQAGSLSGARPGSSSRGFRGRGYSQSHRGNAQYSRGRGQSYKGRGQHFVAETPESDVQVCDGFLESDETLYTVSSDKAPITIDVSVNEVPVEFLVDTGANVSIIPETIYHEKFTAVELQPSPVKLRSYSGNSIPVLGEFDAQVVYQGQTRKLPLIVAKGDNVALFGRNWMKEIQLNWSEIFSVINTGKQKCVPNKKFQMQNPEALEKLLDKYKDVFSPGQGTIKGFKAQIHVKSDTSPRFFKPRPVPYSLRESVEKELNRLETAGVVKKVERSEWASPIVVVPKADGSVRICGDYKVTVNPHLEDETYPLPTAEDLFSQLHGGKIFSKIDLSSAYLQLELSEDSKQYLTINTHKGLYQFQRLSFGVATAPLIFQRVMDQILQGMDDVVCSQDDILMQSDEIERDHLAVLENVLERLQRHNVKAKCSKSEFFRRVLKFLGHTVDAEGLHPEEEKVKAIRDLKAPESLKELQSLVGLINYYGKFLPFQAKLMKPLYDLMKTGANWHWSRECQESLDQVKKQLASSPVLVHYDPGKPLTVACDASPFGIGCVLSHVMENGEERPVAYASRTLNSAEKNYAQLEKEALSLVYAVKKFHKFLYGRRFTLITDHKPLCTILGPKTGVPTLAAHRLQRWALILMAHQYDIRYRRSSDHGNCDALSRLPISGNDQDAMESPIYFFNYTDQLPVKGKDIAKETSADPVLSKAYDYTLSGWPNHCADASLAPYFRRRNELSVDQGCLLWGRRVVVPAKFRERLLAELHDGHPGIVRMKACARNYLWYPGIDSDIEDCVSSCESCAAVQKSPPVAPLHPWRPSGQTWERIHIDFAEFQGLYYLIIVCANTKWLEAVMMQSITTAKTIRALRSKFAQFGIPDEIVSDNGPQFTSSEFATFMTANGIQHTRVPPYHPASNGQAERNVATIKSALKKHFLDSKRADSQVTIEERLDSFLLMYRTTPHATTGVSPAELFLKRRPKTRFDLLKPNLKSTIQEAQDVQKRGHDTPHSSLRNFTVGEIVRVKSHVRGVETFLKGSIAKQLGPLTYLVKIGTKCRFTHVDHLLKTGERHLSPEDLEDNVPVSASPSVMESMSHNSQYQRAETQSHGVDPQPSVAMPSSCTDNLSASPGKPFSGTDTVPHAADPVTGSDNSVPALRRSIRSRKTPERLIEKM